MHTPFRILRVAGVVVAALALCIMAVWMVSRVRVKLVYEPVIISGADAYVAALGQNLSPDAFEQIVKANPEGRQFALGLYAYNNLTNHVRILLKHGAAPDETITSLSHAGESNSVTMIQNLIVEMKELQ